MPPKPRLHPDDAAVVDRFVHHTLVVAGRSPGTAARHRSNLGRFLTWCRRHELDARTLAVGDVRIFLDHERARGLTDNALAAVQDTIRAFYDHVRPDRANPARAFPLPKLGPRRLRPCEPGERDAIIDRLRRGQGIGPRFDLAVVSVLAGTGIRRIELLALRTADLDLGLGRGVLFVRDGPTGHRSLPLPAATAEVLSGYLDEVRPVCPSSELLFANPRASFDGAGYGRLQPWGAGDIVRRAGRRAGVEGPHTCLRWRMTAIVELLRAGVAVEEVGRRLGHGELGTTAQYLRFLDGRRAVGPQRPQVD